MSQCAERENSAPVVRRCPRLGGAVSLAYCIKTGHDTLPCRGIMDCWWERFDVVSFLRTRLSPEEFSRLCEDKPASKINQIAELALKAKTRLGCNGKYDSPDEEKNFHERDPWSLK
jgi:hypothetical protein